MQKGYKYLSRYMVEPISLSVILHCLVIVNEHIDLVTSRQMLSELAENLSSLPDESTKEICHFIISKVQPRAMSFEDQVGLSNDRTSAN